MRSIHKRANIKIRKISILKMVKIAKKGGNYKHEESVKEANYTDVEIPQWKTLKILGRLKTKTVKKKPKR